MKSLIIVFITISASADVLSAKGKKSIDLQCPEVLTVHSSAHEIPKGWHMWDKAEEGKNAVKKLSGVGLYEGHPGENYHLAPDNADSKENFSVWTFSPFGEKRKVPIWVACQYEDTQVRIAKSLPTRIIKCRMEFTTNTDSKKFGPTKCE